MNDLPVPTGSNDQRTTNDVSQVAPQSLSVSPNGKEGGSFSIESKVELPLTPVGHEVDLPKELEQTGVKVQETTVPLPQIVTEQGVQSVKHNVPPHPTSGTTITLPLTDDQIEYALKQHVEFSIRWLAEWCTYQMKKMQNNLHSHHL